MKAPDVFCMGLVLAALALPGMTAPAESPVPVVREPHHKVALENSWVRLLDVRLSPGVQTFYHVHTVRSVVVELTRSTIVSQELGRPPSAPRQVEPGEIRYAAYDEKPLTHRVSNAGNVPFHVMDIELLGGDRLGPAVLPAQPGLKLDWERKGVRVYHGRPSPAAGLRVPPGSSAHLLIDVSGRIRIGGAEGRSGEIGPGEFRFFSPQKGFAADAREPAECVLLELAGD